MKRSKSDHSNFSFFTKMNGISVISPGLLLMEIYRNLNEFFLWYFLPILISVLSSYLCAIINLFIRIMHSPRYVLYNSKCSLEFIKIYYVLVQSLSHVQLFVTLWTIARQTPLCMGFSRQEYWNELPFPTPGNLFDTGVERMSLVSPALAGGFFTTKHHLRSPM